MNVLVTGGAGFIGSAYVRHRLETHPEHSVRVLDKLTYAGRRENLRGLDESRLDLVVADIADAAAVKAALDGCEAIVNFAAETHVDRSITAPGEFIQTDVFGTYVLLEAARHAGVRYLQISTDEVYGSIDEGSFTESSPIDPSSPYSASPPPRSAAASPGSAPAGRPRSAPSARSLPARTRPPARPRWSGATWGWPDTGRRWCGR